MVIQSPSRSPRPRRYGRWTAGLALIVLIPLAFPALTIPGMASQRPDEPATIAGSTLYLPVTLRGIDDNLTGLQVLNSGSGDVTIDLPGGMRNVFLEGTRANWWFPIGNGHYTATAFSSSGPCAALVSLGGNIYQIEIDFRRGELRHINFSCLDTSRPPDGTGWMLYYYLEE